MAVIPDVPSPWPRKWVGDPELNKHLQLLMAFFDSLFTNIDTPFPEHAPITGDTTLVGLGDMLILITAAAEVTLPVTAKDQQRIIVHYRTTGLAKVICPHNGGETEMTFTQIYNTVAFMYVESLTEWIKI